MNFRRLGIAVVLTVTIILAVAPESQAVSPKNPYRTFNLSGVNYGSMQWERAQRKGKRVWTPTNTSSRRAYRRR
jgi:hypothetical protein